MPAGFLKSQVVFNFHRAAVSNQQSLVVVEGYFDCLKVHQAGFQRVVALMGTVLSEAQERLILARFPRVTLMLDGDESGQRATDRIAAQLAGKCDLRLAMVPVAKQPDQLCDEQLRALLEPDEGE